MKCTPSFLRATALLLGAAPALVSCAADHVAAPARNAIAVNRSSGSGRSDPISDPHFLTADPAAPTIANPVIGFWAKQGIDQSVRMVYHARPGHTDSTTFLVFRVRARSLVSDATGAPLAPGDSVFITLSLVDPVNLVVDFQPSGLRFSQSHPASLKLEYGEVVQDYNGDGVIDSTDVAISRTFRIWRRESLLDPWSPLPSVVDTEIDEVTTDIPGFTGYALAF
jgi:hypothetical protein